MKSKLQHFHFLPMHRRMAHRYAEATEDVLSYLRFNKCDRNLGVDDLSRYPEWQSIRDAVFLIRSGVLDTSYVSIQPEDHGEGILIKLNIE